MSEVRRANSLLLLAIKPIRDCLVFAGRSTRSELLAFSVLGMIANAARVHFPDELSGAASAIGIGWGLLWSFPYIALTVRRLHDQGRSAWWMLVPAAVVPASLAALFLPQGSGGVTITLLVWTAIPAPGPVTTLLSGALFLTFVATIVLEFMPGENGRNHYGPYPRIDDEPTVSLP